MILTVQIKEHNFIPLTDNHLKIETENGGSENYFWGDIFTIFIPTCLLEQYQSLSQEINGADMQFRNSWAARNLNQGLRNVL